MPLTPLHSSRCKLLAIVYLKKANERKNFPQILNILKFEWTATHKMLLQLWQVSSGLREETRAPQVCTELCRQDLKQQLPCIPGSESPNETHTWPCICWDQLPAATCSTRCSLCTMTIKKFSQDSPDDTVKNPPANAGDTSSASSLGRSCMPRSN